MKFLGRVGHGPGTNEFNSGDNPDHHLDPGVRIHWIIDYAGVRQRSVLSEHFELQMKQKPAYQ